jgi:hypothetical protein
MYIKRSAIYILVYEIVAVVNLVQFPVGQANAQSAVEKFVKANSAIYQMSVNNSFRQGDAVYQFSFAERSDVLGDPYIDAHWGKSSVLLYDSSVLKGYLTRYDIRLDEIEFKLSEGVRTLKGNKVRSVLWIDSLKQTTRLISNGKEFSSDEKLRKGFYEVLVNGKIVLLKRVLVEILRPDYNIALDVGSRDFRIIKKQKLFFSVNGEIFDLKRKNLLTTLKAESIDVTSYLDKQQVGWNEQYSLEKLFEHINSIPNGSD